MNKVKIKSIDWLTFMQEVQAIAQTGLTYGKDVYDKERYEQLLKLVSEHYAEITGIEESIIQKTLFNEVGYATPKICVRGIALKDEKVLLVKERAEGLWSLPGGWTEVNLSPAESLVKEVKEETGFDCRVTRLLSLWDKQKHEHPKHWPHTYVAFFLYEILGGEKKTSHEISDVDYFAIDNFPELSTHRVTKKQIETLVGMVKNNSDSLFD